ncbi:MAG: hypothetical protein WBV71_10705, partial [Roseobacter sp.]
PEARMKLSLSSQSSMVMSSLIRSMGHTCHEMQLRKRAALIKSGPIEWLRRWDRLDDHVHLGICPA